MARGIVLVKKLKNLSIVAGTLGIVFFLQSCPGKPPESKLYGGLLPMYVGAVDFSHETPRFLLAGLKESDKEAGRVIYYPNIDASQPHNSYVFRHGDRILSTPATMAGFLPDSTSRILTLGYDIGSNTYSASVWEIKTLPTAAYQFFSDQPVVHFSLGKIEHGPLEGLHNNLTDRYSRNLAISQDGKKMMLGGCRLSGASCVEGEAKVWSLVDGKLLGTVKGGKDIYYTSFTPDGTKIVATYKDTSKDGSSFETAGVWSAVDYKPIKKPLAAMYYVSSLAVSRDSRQLLVFGSDQEKGTAHLWDLNTNATEPRVIEFRNRNNILSGAPLLRAPFLQGAFSKDASGFYAFNATVRNHLDETYSWIDFSQLAFFSLKPSSPKTAQPDVTSGLWEIVFGFKSWNFSFNADESKFIAISSIENLVEFAVYTATSKYWPDFYHPSKKLNVFLNISPYYLRDEIP